MDGKCTVKPDELAERVTGTSRYEWVGLGVKCTPAGNRIMVLPFLYPVSVPGLQGLGDAPRVA